jgi:hypothetical protein
VQPSDVFCHETIDALPVGRRRQMIHDRGKEVGVSRKEEEAEGRLGEALGAWQARQSKNHVLV